MKITSYILTFILGVGVGGFAIQKLIKDKYKQMADEEIESVKEVFLNKNNDNVEKPVLLGIDLSPEVEAEKARNKPDISTYTSLVNNSDYSSKSISEKPYVISPEEFGNIDEYEKVSLTYYADKVLTDENDDLIGDADDIIGVDSLKHFGEYEDDSVFVRNDKLKCDYEILLDQRYYEDICYTKPHPLED